MPPRALQNLREDKSFTYGAYSTNQVARSSAVFRVSSDVRNDVTEAAVAEFVEFARLGEPILRRASGRDGLPRRRLPHPAPDQRAAAGRLAWMMRMDLSTQWLTDYRSAVTSADAVDAAGATIADRDRLTLVMVGEVEQVDPRPRHASRAWPDGAPRGARG